MWKRRALCRDSWYVTGRDRINGKPEIIYELSKPIVEIRFLWFSVFPSLAAIDFEVVRVIEFKTFSFPPKFIVLLKLNTSDLTFLPLCTIFNLAVCTVACHVYPVAIQVYRFN
jgi:hypothetical protein